MEDNHGDFFSGEVVMGEVSSMLFRKDESTKGMQGGCKNSTGKMPY